MDPDDWQDEYDPETLRGCLADASVVTTAIGAAALVVALMWHVIGAIIDALICR